MELTLFWGSYVGTSNIFLPEALHNPHLMLVLGMISGTLLDQVSGAKEVEETPQFPVYKILAYGHSVREDGASSCSL